MSLESKIEQLTAAVEALTARIDALATPATAPKAEKKPSSKPAPAPAPEPEAEAEAPQEVTEQELMDLCMSIVRRDRGLKDKVKSIIAEHGGKTIGEVDKANYTSLKTALEAV